MARVKNTMQLVEKSKGHIGANYDIRTNNIIDIYYESTSIYDSIVNGFCFGYMQGMKAAKAEIKRVNS